MAEATALLSRMMRKTVDQEERKQRERLSEGIQSFVLMSLRSGVI
jgi:hypothetical protein